MLPRCVSPVVGFYGLSSGRRNSLVVVAEFSCRFFFVTMEDIDGPPGLPLSSISCRINDADDGSDWFSDDDAKSAASTGGRSLLSCSIYAGSAINSGPGSEVGIEEGEEEKDEKDAKEAKRERHEIRQYVQSLQPSCLSN